MMQWYDDLSPETLSRRLLRDVEEGVRGCPGIVKEEWQAGTQSSMHYSVHKLSFENVGSDEHPALSSVAYHLARYPSRLARAHNAMYSLSEETSMPERHWYVQVSANPFVEGKHRYGDVSCEYLARERVWDPERSKHVTYRDYGERGDSEKQFILGEAVGGVDRLRAGQGPTAAGVTPGSVMIDVFEDRFSGGD
jgi:hypothetical protein